ncbi:hypothetical protein D1007_11547 [Hordeum vulgare]|nr:hypothetical protein D1007_11547 [Hordeum vulgare]
MDYDALSNEEYGPRELDQMIQDEFFDSSDSDKEVDMIMLMTMQEEMHQQVEHIIIFKGSNDRRRVINRDRVSRAKLLLKDYFALNPTDGVLDWGVLTKSSPDQWVWSRTPMLVH